MSLSPYSTIAASNQQISCDLSGEASILSLADGEYYRLDAIGARIWNLIQQPCTFAELRDTLLREYEVAPAQLESDLRELLAQLAEHRLIVTTAGEAPPP